MINPRRPFVLLLLAVVLILPHLSAADYPPHVIGGSQLRVLEPTADGRHYQLSIGLPASYESSPDKHYPVVFVTDGYWDFSKMMIAEGSLVYDRVAPEFIVVGMGYAGEGLDYGTLRGWELSPVPSDNPNRGHAATFLQTIKNTFIPFVESEYRVDSEHRVLAGASLGGLFTLYAMYTEPDLFSAYIAATPAVASGNEWLLNYEKEFFASGRPLHARLWVSIGGDENIGFTGSALRYNAIVANRDYPGGGLAYKFRIIDGERHAGMQIESYVRGLRWVFEPLAPETGPVAPRN